MREWLRFQAPTVAAFLAMSLVATGLALAFPTPHVLESGSPVPAQAIDLPSPEEDQDRDSYSDAVDLTDGDLRVGVRLLSVSLPSAKAQPYVLLGTQDDHWRSGAGAELEWRHVVDPDSLGFRAGSPAWQDSVLRTGAWWMSRPGEGLDIAIAESAQLTDSGAQGAHWPQTLWANVRDDRSLMTLDMELRDAGSSPHVVAGQWHIEVDVANGTTHLADGSWGAMPAQLDLVDGRTRLTVQVMTASGPSLAQRQAIAQKWAPTLRFDSEEAFTPVQGALLEQFHGFSRLAPNNVDLRTWDLGFNAGRDPYRLFLADFNGDASTDHVDVQILADVLAEGTLGRPAVHATVDVTTDDQVVVQYWFLYLYNFVLEESGRDLPILGHRGDREFMQLTFPTLETALNGTPSAMAFSQHYAGLLVENLNTEERPLRNGHPAVYVARGSHASYPAPGDDRRLRSSLTSIFDHFDGGGLVLSPDNYTLELLGGQSWHAGYKWGPVTRYGRDLGTSSRPLLQHDFRYPFVDPLWWQAGLLTATPDDLEAMYGRLP